MISQVLCMVCKHASNRYESMLDLCLHITDSDITSIDSALGSFVQPEWLDGDNKYQCDRCDAKVRARRVSAPVPLPLPLSPLNPTRLGWLHASSLREHSFLTFALTLTLRSSHHPWQGR